MGSKKHKKHKSEKKDRYEEKQSGVDKPGLKLILKVGSSSTPEHSSDSPGPPSLPAQSSSNYSVTAMADEESRQSLMSLHGKEESHSERQHKKNKKKKKKKDKDKDRDKHEKKHKHHHKEKRKRLREESSQDDISMGEESLSDPPLPKRLMDNNSVAAKNNAESNQNSTGTPDSGQGGVIREPRSCVLRQRQERTALQRLLDHLLKNLEKRDPQQFFAWPVTDHIAPGYSQIISQPMDFSTMKQKIDDNQYPTLGDFIEDFKLMCNNATVYNHPETIYFKAAKKLLHVGLKVMSPEKLKPLRSVVTYMSEISREELGFDLGYEDLSASGAGVKTESGEEQGGGDDMEDSSDAQHDLKKKSKEATKPLSKFEAIPDDMTPEEILAQAQKAAAGAAERLSLRQPAPQMGFLRQRKDGTTSLAILVPNDGVLPGTNERPVSLGTLCGKLTHGTGQLQGFREDRRNLAKTIKPLYYGAFGSYAPSYDSTFANLSKEETDLVYQTYGDETAVQYAESILDFSKDCDYTLTMVDDLLDLLTGYEHRKTKQFLEERRQLREEEEKIRQMMEDKPVQVQSSGGQQPDADVNIDINGLKSLNDLGIDVSFLDNIESALKTTEEREAIQSRLDHTSSLIQKLHQVQNDRLSLPPPQHLAHIQQPSENEVQLAEKITESLKDMVKKVPPHEVAPVPAIRKAMGVRPRSEPDSPNPVTEENPTSVASEALGEEVDVEGPSSQAAVEMERDEETNVGPAGGADVPDLESELREFLESEPALSNSPLHDDKTIEEILSVS